MDLKLCDMIVASCGTLNHERRALCRAVYMCVKLDENVKCFWLKTKAKTIHRKKTKTITTTTTTHNKTLRKMGKNVATTTETTANNSKRRYVSSWTCTNTNTNTSTYAHEYPKSAEYSRKQSPKVPHAESRWHLRTYPEREREGQRGRDRDR